MRIWLTAISLALAAAGAVFLLAVPTYTATSGNQHVPLTLLAVNGTGAAIPVLFPVAAALAALLFGRQAARVIAAVLISGFALIALSIGLFYLPAGIVMALAACVPDRKAAR